MGLDFILPLATPPSALDMGLEQGIGRQKSIVLYSFGLCGNMIRSIMGIRAPMRLCGALFPHWRMLGPGPSLLRFVASGH